MPLRPGALVWQPAGILLRAPWCGKMLWQLLSCWIRSFTSSSQVYKAVCVWAYRTGEAAGLPLIIAFCLFNLFRHKSGFESLCYQTSPPLSHRGTELALSSHLREVLLCLSEVWAQGFWRIRSLFNTCVSFLYNCILGSFGHGSLSWSRAFLWERQGMGSGVSPVSPGACCRLWGAGSHRWVRTHVLSAATSHSFWGRSGGKQKYQRKCQNAELWSIVKKQEIEIKR